MNNQNTNSNFEAEKMIKRINLIFFALLGGILIFLAFMLYQVEVLHLEVYPESDSVFKFIIPAIALAGIIAGKVLSGINIKKARESQGQTRLMLYQTSQIIKFALLEGPSLFTIIAYQQTGNRQYLIILAILLFILIFSRPNIDKYRNEVEQGL